MKKKKNVIPRFSVYKSLKDYLFDFLMLFIAVTLGFFSNNLREGIIDHNREKDYIVRLIRDIEVDTAEIHELVNQKKDQVFGFDTLLRLFEYSNLNPPVDELYRLAFKYLGTYSGFQARTVTIDQMQNAGDLNLIRDKAVADSIIFYYAGISGYDDQGDYNQQFFQRIIEMRMEMFDFSVYRNPARKLSLRYPDRLPELYNQILFMGAFIQGDREWLRVVSNNGRRLTEFLRKHYGL
ncbi:MAG: hypothetical protein U0T82_08675 [Bacteroidales bacterium]